jgi:hypothetical protein
MSRIVSVANRLETSVTIRRAESLMILLVPSTRQLAVTPGPMIMLPNLRFKR